MHKFILNTFILLLQTSLNIFISEAEERDPRFEHLHYRFAVVENQAGVLVGRVELKPRKHRINSLMKYTIVNSEMRNLFNITSVSYHILYDSAEKNT